MRVSRLFVPPILLATSLQASSGKNTPARDPIAWGVLNQNSGCVIFEEGRKTKAMYWGVAVTAKVSGKLTVIETQDYKLPQKEYVETQEVMDDLTRIAQKDHVKFVKIPEKYSPELLEKARAMCKGAEQAS